MVQLSMLSPSCQSQAQRPPCHPQLVQSFQDTCPPASGECPTAVGSPHQQGNAAACSFMSRQQSRGLEGSENASGLPVASRNPSWRTEKP